MVKELTVPTEQETKPTVRDERGDGLPPTLADRVGFLLARTQLAIRERAETALIPFGLGDGSIDCSPRHVGCLAVIADEGPMSQHALGKSIGLDRTTIVAIVDWLESQGFVERRRNPTDRRAYALEITEAGSRWLSQANSALRTTEREFLAPLSAAERKQLIALLQRLMLAHQG
jgi:DNA-binding MarR family transcriptional regulator